MKTAIIIGAGPAGLTTALELLRRTDIRPIVLERDDILGGLSRTVNYKGNRIDIGGHRFFSKSDRVMDWWQEILPQGDPEAEDEVMLLRGRKSRIYFLRKFFAYPIALTAETIKNLGLWRTFKIGMSYMRAMAFPIKKEKNLEDFLINRFGRELYNTFFKSYTEKVWGVPCTEIKPEWGAQRIKGLSITRAIKHFLTSRKKKTGDVSQKDTETSLIERFLYPKLGPGQMWEVVAEKVKELGGEIHTGCNVDRIEMNGEGVTAIGYTDASGENVRITGDCFFSTMAIKDLVRAIKKELPSPVRQVAEGLVYRDFLTVGLLLEKIKLKEKDGQPLQDNWIYIQEPDVLVGRLQIFHNWSPWMIADRTKAWVGLEYFCNEGDDLWRMPDEKLRALGAVELEKMGFIDRADVLDGIVIRMPKTYPAYFGTYDRFPVLRDFLDGIPNLYPLGRNGMHRYNNQDHAMLTAMTAVDNLVAGKADKTNIWDVNTEQEYHEEKKTVGTAK